MTINDPFENVSYLIHINKGLGLLKLAKTVLILIAQVLLGLK